MLSWCPFKFQPQISVAPRVYFFLEKERRGGESPSWCNLTNVQTLFSVKEPLDYQGRSFMHVPQDVGVNLKSEFPPDKCFLPKKHIHTWTGHTKGDDKFSSTLLQFDCGLKLLFFCFRSEAVTRARIISQNHQADSMWWCSVRLFLLVYLPGIAAIRWFPKYAHLLLSAGMDTKIKVPNSLLHWNKYYAVDLCRETSLLSPQGNDK